MALRINLGDRVPYVTLACLEHYRIVRTPLAEAVAGTRVLIVGVAGAFTPSASAQIPGFSRNFEKIRAAGYDKAICIAPDNPWVLRAWAPQVDAAGRLEFLSDGNLALARALGASVVDHDHFMGERSARYLLITRSGVVERFILEPNLAELAEPAAGDSMLVD